MSEILGLDRDQPNRGGPIVFYCERFHNELHATGRPRPCTDAQAAALGAEQEGPK
jgi:hypothetical protein